MPFAPAPLEELEAKFLRLGADGFGAHEDLPGLSGGVEHPLGIGQIDVALVRGAGVTTDQRQGLQIADFDLVFVETNQNDRTDRRRPRRVPGAIGLDGGVVQHGARAFGEVAEAFDGQGLELRALFLEHLLDLALGPAVDTLGRPVLFPVGEIGVLRLDRLEAPPLERRGLGMLDCRLDGSLAIGIPDARRVGHHAVVG